MADVWPLFIGDGNHCICAQIIFTIKSVFV